MTELNSLQNPKDQVTTKHKCNFCDKIFSHASGLSRHKTDVHSTQRAMSKELKNRSCTDTYSGMLMHIVAEGTDSHHFPQTKPRYAATYDNILPGSNITCDTLEFIKLLLDDSLSIDDVSHGKLVFNFNDFRYVVPLIILDSLGHIHGKEITIPHDFLFVNPINLSGCRSTGVNIGFAIYAHEVKLDLNLSMIIKESLLDIDARRRLPVQFNVRHFYPLKLDTGSYEINIYGLFGGILYANHPQKILLKLDNLVRIDYNNVMLPHITETVKDLKYLSINGDTIKSAFNRSTLDGQRVTSTTLDIELGSTETVYFDLMNTVNTYESIKPYGLCGITTRQTTSCQEKCSNCCVEPLVTTKGQLSCTNCSIALE